MNKLKIGKIRRKSITVSTNDLVEVTPLSNLQSLPILITPSVPDLDLISWANNHQNLIQEKLLKFGGIILRTCQVDQLEKFEQFIKSTSDRKLLSYQDGSSPRTLLQDNIYTSTDYPASQTIFLHSELSYASTYPLKIYFHCVKSADQGGETPIADTRKIYRRLSLEIRDRFAEKQVMYVRNFGAGLGIPWQQAFETSSKSAVEQYCQNNGIVMVWGDN
ncbi:MAG: TauD/TfdA family dioxygenase, partial [Cyanobacteria bacterium P01_C01_bin.72]